MDFFINRFLIALLNNEKHYLTGQILVFRSEKKNATK